MRLYVYCLTGASIFLSCSKGGEGTVNNTPTPPPVTPVPTVSVPSVVTNFNFQSSNNSITIGGSITADGGSAVSQRGVCWATTPNPTINASRTTDGAGLGSYSSSITGLIEGARYYVRGYATNAVGTAYGREVEVQPHNAITNIDQAMLSKLSQYQVQAASIAIVRNERLVYMRAYGVADREENVAAAPQHLFRIASLSKPITLALILRLVQEGRLSLDQRVFGTGSILGNDYGTIPAGSNKEQITVRHLLDHKSGWVNVPNDPMFTDITRTQTQIINDVLQNRALVTVPGSTYYYLNFGYLVLGRIIEKITTVSYPQYIRSYFTSIGINSIQVGGSTLVERVANEVKYYQSEFNPYGLNVQRMDAHGGLLSRANDLARFIARIDRNTFVPDIVGVSLLNNFYTGLTNWDHYGSLPGTSALLSRVNNNVSFVVLLNGRTESNPNLILDDIKNTLSTQINSVTNWTTVDLF